MMCQKWIRFNFEFPQSQEQSTLLNSFWGNIFSYHFQSFCTYSWVLRALKKTKTLSIKGFRSKNHLEGILFGPLSQESLPFIVPSQCLPETHKLFCHFFKRIRYQHHTTHASFGHSEYYELKY